MKYCPNCGVVSTLETHLTMNGLMHKCNENTSHSAYDSKEQFEKFQRIAGFLA